jgi:hypothetical protein
VHQDALHLKVDDVRVVQCQEQRAFLENQLGVLLALGDDLERRLGMMQKINRTPVCQERQAKSHHDW